MSPGRSREREGIFDASSSELSDEVPLLALSDLPLALPLSAVDASLGDGSGSGGVPDDCCLRFRYSDMDN